jgi:hypothetical protein
MRRSFSVYILASMKRGTLYIGVTNDLARRLHEYVYAAAPLWREPARWPLPECHATLSP